MAGLVALLLGLNRGAEWGWFSLPTLALLASTPVLFIIFIWIECRTSDPMLDLTLFHHPLFNASAINAVLNYICVYTITFLIPFYLIQGRGLNAAQAGMLLTSQPVIMAIAAPISGTLSDRIGSRLPGMLGMLILASGLFILSRLNPATPLWIAALGMAICGLGTGIFISPNNSALMGSAPRSRQGIAAGILASSRNMGMVLGIGLAGAILTTHLARDAANGIFSGIRLGFVVAAGVAILGMLTAAVKER